MEALSWIVIALVALVVAAALALGVISAPHARRRLTSRPM